MLTEYQAGTVSIAQGETIVKGAGTSWLSYIKVGDQIELAGTSFPIAEVIDVSTLRLAEPFTSPSLSRISYRIVITHQEN